MVQMLIVAVEIALFLRQLFPHQTVVWEQSAIRLTY